MKIEEPAMTEKTDRQPGRTARYGLLRTVLLCIGISYLLAAPFIVYFVLAEIDYPDELCMEIDVSWPGIWMEEAGTAPCKFLFHRILLFWSIPAVLFSPVATAGVLMRRHMSRLAEGTGPTSRERYRDGVSRNVGIGVLLVYLIGATLIAVI